MSAGSSSAIELQRFSWSHGQGSGSMYSAVTSVHNAGRPGAGFDSALAAGAQRALLYLIQSGAQIALRGLRFISTKTNGVDAWNEVQS